MNMEPSQHPLADVIKRNKDKVDFTWATTHPTLPFAILSGGKYDEILLIWGEGRNQNPLSLSNGSSKYFAFSADGKWVAFQEGGVMDHLPHARLREISQLPRLADITVE